MATYREQVIACARYGELKRNETMHTIEIMTPALIIRSTLLGNPLTVFRRPACTAAEVDAFHTVIGFVDEGAA